MAIATPSVTPFSPELKKYSDRIHREWRDSIYPTLYGVSKDAIQYCDDVPENTLKVLDLRFGIDCVFRVSRNGFRDSFLKTAQYRFRDVETQHYQDLTITVWNNVSNQRSELFKMTAMLFTYGYFNAQINRLVEVVVVDAPHMINAIEEGRLRPSTTDDPLNPRSQQPFQGYKFNGLKRLGLVYLHLKEVNGKLVAQPTKTA